MKTIFVTTEFEGLHYWLGAKAPVEYLRNPHRHLFKVRLEIIVKHDERDIEFISFKNQLTHYCKVELGSRAVPYSCETMCQYILNWAAEYIELKIHTGDGDRSTRRVYSVSVSEDGENGACWYADK